MNKEIFTTKTYGANVELTAITRCKDCKWHPYYGVDKDINLGFGYTCPMWDEGDVGYGACWHGEDEGWCYKGERME